MKFNIEEKEKVFIPKSQIINLHVVDQINGIRVGKWFWVYGGLARCTDKGTIEFGI